jgi:hypothetical protein
MPWNPLTQSVDFVLLAGQRTPGIAELQGFDSPRHWDVRRGYAQTGATTVFRGIGVAERGKLVIRLYTEQDWEDWDAFLPLLKRPPIGSHSKALDISHPFTEALGIRAVVVSNVSQPVQTDSGEWTIEVALIEHRRPQVQLARTDGSQEGTEVGDPVLQTLTSLNRIAENGGDGDLGAALAPILNGFARGD